MRITSLTFGEMKISVTNVINKLTGFHPGLTCIKCQQGLYRVLVKNNLIIRELSLAVHPGVQGVPQQS